MNLAFSSLIFNVAAWNLCTWCAYLYLQHRVGIHYLLYEKFVVFGQDRWRGKCCNEAFCDVSLKLLLLILLYLKWPDHIFYVDFENRHFTRVSFFLCHYWGILAFIFVLKMSFKSSGGTNWPKFSACQRLEAMHCCEVKAVFYSQVQLVTAFPLEKQIRVHSTVVIQVLVTSIEWHRRAHEWDNFVSCGGNRLPCFGHRLHT